LNFTITLYNIIIGRKCFLFSFISLHFYDFLVSSSPKKWLLDSSVVAAINFKSLLLAGELVSPAWHGMAFISWHDITFTSTHKDELFIRRIYSHNQQLSNYLYVKFVCVCKWVLLKKHYISMKEMKETGQGNKIFVRVPL